MARGHLIFVGLCCIVDQLDVFVNLCCVRSGTSSALAPEPPRSSMRALRSFWWCCLCSGSRVGIHPCLQDMPAGTSPCHLVWIGWQYLYSSSRIGHCVEWNFIATSFAASAISCLWSMILSKSPPAPRSAHRDCTLAWYSSLSSVSIHQWAASSAYHDLYSEALALVLYYPSCCLDLQQNRIAESIPVNWIGFCRYPWLFSLFDFIFDYSDFFARYSDRKTSLKSLGLVQPSSSCSISSGPGSFAKSQRSSCVDWEFCSWRWLGLS